MMTYQEIVLYGYLREGRETFDNLFKKVAKWSKPKIREVKKIKLEDNLKISISKEIQYKIIKSNKLDNITKLFVPTHTKLSTDLIERLYPTIKLVDKHNDADAVLYTNSSKAKVQIAYLKKHLIDRLSVKYYIDNKVIHAIPVKDLRACTNSEIEEKFTRSGYISVSNPALESKFINLNDFVNTFRASQNADLSYEQFEELSKQIRSKNEQTIFMALQAICSYDSSHNELKNFLISLAMARLKHDKSNRILDFPKIENLYFYGNLLGELAAVLRQHSNVFRANRPPLDEYKKIYDYYKHPFIKTLMRDSSFMNDILKISQDFKIIFNNENDTDISNMLL